MTYRKLLLVMAMAVLVPGAPGLTLAQQGGSGQGAGQGGGGKPSWADEVQSSVSSGAKDGKGGGQKK